MNLKKHHRFILILALFFLSPSGFAQNFEWLKSLGTKKNDELRGISAEPNGGCSFILSIGYKDSLLLASVKYFSEQGDFLVRLDSLGNVIKVRPLGASVQFISRDNNGNFYIAASWSNYFDSLNLHITNGKMIYAKYDNKLNRIWIKQTGEKDVGLFRSLSFSNGHLLFMCSGQNTINIGPKTFNFYNSENYAYGEIDPSNGNILWCNSLYNSSSFSDLVILRDIQYLKGKYYLIGMCSMNIMVGKDSFYYGGFIAQTDSLGGYIKRYCINNKTYSGFYSLTTDGEYLYCGGGFLDSFFFDGKKIISQYPHSAPKKGDGFVASLTSELKLRWLYRPKVLDIKKSSIGMAKASANEGYKYFGGTLGTKIQIDSNILTPSAFYEDALFIKMDYMGNVLWANTGGSDYAQIYGLDAIAGKSVFIGGFFEKRIKFGSHSDTSKGEKDGWITKLSDNSIFRSNIYKGPYCAGDSIKVPFSKEGTYDSSNYFIAELSNEKGDFENGGMELGRIKSINSGTVVGKLPLFQVSSSGKYRIRIRSTKPAVQSFYRIDTLHLLIYSRDKANPGPQETICIGDSIKLNTYGGTKWTWSPKYRMDDSTKRQPWAWPIKDTIYKIIIADSSGCGKPDTAIKKIIVRPKVKAILKFKDTSVCGNSLLTIPVQFQGGDSNYSWQWFFVYLPNSWFPSSKGNLKMTDTINYYTTDPKEVLAIILKDGCTNKADTAYLTISQRKPVTITKSYRDTTLCVGNVLNYKATATGGIPKHYRYQWKDLLTNSILSTADSLKILAKKSLKIQLIVNDGCEALGDTAVFDINVKPELKAITNLRDTTICFGQKLDLKAQANGGNSKAYNFLWLLNGKQIDTNNQLQLTINNTSNLLLVTTDNCSPNDTVKKQSPYFQVQRLILHGIWHVAERLPTLRLPAQNPTHQ